MNHQNGPQGVCLRRQTGAVKASAGAEISHSSISFHREGQENCPKRQIEAVAIHGDAGKKNPSPPLIG